MGYVKFTGEVTDFGKIKDGELFAYADHLFRKVDGSEVDGIGGARILHHVLGGDHIFTIQNHVEVRRVTI